MRPFKVIQGHWNRPVIGGFLLLFSSNFVSKTYRFRDIRLQKCCDLEIWVRGPSRSLDMSPFDRAHVTSYWRAIVTMALSHVVSEIFIHCPKMSWRWNLRQRSLNVIESGTINDRLCMTSYNCSIVTSNFFRKMNRFWDIRLQKCCDLENRVRGPSRSLEMSPFDRAHMTSYWRSIVTMALPRVASEILNVEICRDLEIGVRGHSRSWKVVPFDKLWYGFLLVFYCNFVRKMYRFLRHSTCN